MTMTLDAALDVLFAPYVLDRQTLRNRLVMAPMTRHKSPDRTPNDENVAYYAARAAGGIGLIISEGTLVDISHASHEHDVPRMAAATVTPWRKVTAAVHDAGAAIFCQLWHLGPQARAGIGPEEIVKDGRVVVRRCRAADLDGLLRAYPQAAAHARDAGFDGIELHGAHGYLLHAFLRHGARPVAADAAVTGRDLVVDIVRRIRATVGADFPIALRFSQWEVDNYDNKYMQTPDDLKAMLLPLRDAGVDVFHASTRRFWLSEFAESHQTLAGWTRQLTGKPTITVGGLGLSTAELTGAGEASLVQMAERLARGECDLVAIGRAVLSDPEWPNKVRQKRFDEIVEHRR